MMDLRNHQTSELEHIFVFETAGLHCRSPYSGELWYKFRGAQKGFSPTLRTGGSVVPTMDSF